MRNGVCTIDYDPAAVSVATVTAITGTGQNIDADDEINAVDFNWPDLAAAPQSTGDQDPQNDLIEAFGHLIGLDAPCYQVVAGCASPGRQHRTAGRRLRSGFGGGPGRDDVPRLAPRRHRETDAGTRRPGRGLWDLSSGDESEIVPGRRGNLHLHHRRRLRADRRPDPRRRRRDRRQHPRRRRPDRRQHARRRGATGGSTRDASAKGAPGAAASGCGCSSAGPPAPYQSLALAVVGIALVTFRRRRARR